MVCLALAAVVALARVRGTTLVGPCVWAMVSTLTIAAVEGLIQTRLLSESLDAWRFVAATSIFSPWMSLIGAKRPQDSAWHFIVASLWGMQALPAAEVLFLRPGQPLAIIDFRAYFLIALVVLTFLIHLPTRYALAGALASAGQLALVWNVLPWSDPSSNNAVPVAIATALFAAATLVSLWQMWCKPKKDSPFDNVWSDFRDAFGALWSARVMERVNAAAVLYQWPFRLGWMGFHDAAEPNRKAEISPALAVELRRVLDGLLRRFVSDAWTDQRLSDL